MSEDKTDLKKEIDKALKYWNRQAKQAGDNISMESYIEGIRASGFSYVKWVTQKDIKVCAECAERDGKIFEIDKIFIPLHYNCRCNLVPYDKQSDNLHPVPPRSGMKSIARSDKQNMERGFSYEKIINGINELGNGNDVDRLRQ